MMLPRFATKFDPRILLNAAVGRPLELGLAVSILLLLGPLMGFVALAVLVESGRPIFFSQTRLGQGGRYFRMHKFRKFHADGQTGCPLTVENDPRMTRVGRLIARTKLDELPQLWNIIKGDMSFIGPRPESLNFADCFEGAYRTVLDHKPGIFGPSQGIFRNEARLYRGTTDPEQFYREVLFPLKAEIDLAYFSQRTRLRDLACAISCIFAVLGCFPKKGPLSTSLQRWPAGKPDAELRARPDALHASLKGGDRRQDDDQKGRWGRYPAIGCAQLISRWSL
jgi:lipopolysaccharide/colanic/teichoic acid biosynthesis glycosyltransferase